MFGTLLVALLADQSSALETAGDLTKEEQSSTTFAIRGYFRSALNFQKFTPVLVEEGTAVAGNGYLKKLFGAKTDPKQINEYQ